MADPTTDNEFFDCSSLSISYAANGLATISFTIYRPKEDGPPYTSESGFEISAGGVTFKGYVLEQSLVPASEIEYNEWRVTAIAIGCKSGKQLTTSCQ